MSITDIIFVFLFLPLSLVLYYLAKEQYRKYILLAVSLIFYACGSMKYFGLMVCSVAIDIVVGWLIARFREQRAVKAVLLIAGVLYNVSILGYYKYTDFVLTTVGRLTNTAVTLRNLALPMGLSFFTFKAISYLADIYTGKIDVQKNPVYAALYLSFFAQIQSGPLSRYSDMQSISFEGESSEGNRFDSFSEGVYRFMTGFNKKVLISNILANITAETFAVAPGNMSVSFAWLGSICYSLQLFFDFSGYSDMAIGISRMFGYKCPENFYYPYMTNSIAKFWRRWHISLGSWFRDYVYFPLGGSRVNSKLRLYLNLLAVWVLTGIWHGASWNFVFWGLGYFVLIAFEKTTGWPERFRSKAARLGYRIFTLLFINFQWVIFRTEGIKNGLRYIKCMLFCPSNPLADSRALFLLKDNLVFILAGILLCFPVMPWMEEKCSKRRGTRAVWNLAVILVTTALFLWAVSFVVSGQNNPFAYANF